MDDLLPALDPVEARTTRRANLLETATERYTDSFGRAHDLLDKMISTIAQQFPDDPTAARNATADFLEQFGDRIEQNGNNVITALAQQTTNSAIQADQVRELEGKVSDAEARAAQAERDRDEFERGQRELRRSADRASNLQVSIDQLTRDLARTERERDAARQELTEVKQRLDQPNPLNERNRQLEAEKNDLQARLTALTDEHEQLKRQVTDVVAEAQRITDEPDASHAPEPAPAGDGASANPAEEESHTGILDSNGGLAAGQDTPARPKRGRGRRLPGFSRN